MSQDDDTGMPVMTTRDGKERSTKGKYFLVKCVAPRWADGLQPTCQRATAPARAVLRGTAVVTPSRVASVARLAVERAGATSRCRRRRSTLPR